MKLAKPISQFFLLMTVLTTSILSADTVQIKNDLSLDLMSEQITSPHDNYFRHKQLNVEARFQTIEEEYAKLFGKAKRHVDISSGFFIIDLDGNILEKSDDGFYLPSEDCNFPRIDIKNALRKALDQGMTLLFLSSGLHQDLGLLAEHLCQEFELTREEIATRTDFLVGCKTRISSFRLAEELLKIGEFEAAQRHFVASVSKGEVWLSWVIHLIQQDPRAWQDFRADKLLQIPIVMADDWHINLKDVEQSHEASAWNFDMSLVKTFHTEYAGYPNVLKKRQSDWQKIYRHLEALALRKELRKIPFPVPKPSPKAAPVFAAPPSLNSQVKKATNSL